MTKNNNIKLKRRDIWQNQQKAQEQKIVQQKQVQASQHLQKLVQQKHQVTVLVQKNARVRKLASNKNHLEMIFSHLGVAFLLFLIAWFDIINSEVNMKKTYNKLVRDKIPEIINSKPNAKCKTQILSDEEFAKQLNIKLQEEVKEYLESDSVEELADVEEVLRAILDAKNVSNEEFEQMINNNEFLEYACYSGNYYGTNNKFAQPSFLIASNP